MRFAKKNGERIHPNPLEKNAVCPICNAPVIAKCGEIKIWHWAHKSGEDCDSFSDGETEWHLNWKNEFPEDCQEVIIKNHRADVKVKDIVLEFQKSPLSCEQIEEREEFYNKMIWVLPKEFIDNFWFKLKNGFVTFRWKWAKTSWENSNKPKIVDMGISTILDNIPSHKMLIIKKINWGGYTGGWGKIISKYQFIQEVKDGYYGY